MNFLDIKKAAFRRLQVSDTQTGDLNTRIGGFVNRWYRQVLSDPHFRSFRKTQITQATVVDQWLYGNQLMAIDHITERSNERRLIKKSEDWWRRNFPDPTTDTDDSPDWWIPLGQTRVGDRPANASELFAISTAAGDTGTMHVEVIRTDGHRRNLSVTMTGVTGVSLDTAITDVIDVVDVFITAVAVGTVTLREDSGTGTVLATIPIGQAFPRYTKFALAPTPSAVQTLYVDGSVRITDLSQDFDEPIVSEDFHDILADGAVYDEWLAHGRLKDAQWLRDEIEKRILSMKNQVWMDTIQEDSDSDARARLHPERTITLPLS